MSRLPTDSTERKRTPLCTGCLDYAPAALTLVAEYDREDVYPARFLEYLRDRDLPKMAEAALELLQVEIAGGYGHAPEVMVPETYNLRDLFTTYAEALAAVAQVSWHGNEKHNPGLPLHHARGKSVDHFDCIARHYVERGGWDGPFRHSAALAWRCLIVLQEYLEATAGAPLARGARLPEAP